MEDVLLRHPEAMHQAGGDQTRAADARSAMHDDRPARAQRRMEVADEPRQLAGAPRRPAIGHRKRAELDAVFGAKRGLLAQLELADLGRLEQRRDDIDARATPGLDRAAKVVPAARTRREPEAMRREAPHPVDRRLASARRRRRCAAHGPGGGRHRADPTVVPRVALPAASVHALHSFLQAKVESSPPKSPAASCSVSRAAASSTRAGTQSGNASS